MAGPTCSILSAPRISESELIHELISLTGYTEDENSFIVKSTLAIGGHYEGEGRPFIWFMGSKQLEEISFIADALGFIPENDIGLGAMCNKRIDHQILAELALWLAEKTAGFIDLGGVLPVPVNTKGKIVRVPYDTASGWDAEYMVVDPITLRDWLACPSFEMVK